MGRIFLTFVLLFFSALGAYALDVVYPTAKHSTINAPSTFFFGNTKPNSILKIKSKPVSVFNDGIFVQVVPLNYGKNIIKVESTYKSRKKVKTFVILRHKLAGEKELPPYCPKKQGVYLYSKTIKDSATVRQGPSMASKRLVDLPTGVVLYIAGKQGDYYKIETDSDSQFWIHKSNVSRPVEVTKKFYAKIKRPDESSDRQYDYTKIALSHPVLYTLTQHENMLKLTLYNAGDGIEEFCFDDKDKIAGYDANYDNNKLIIRKAKIPRVNEYRPLNNIKIFVDAGHGGSQKGAVGPTRVNEKTINLAIAKKLVTLLQSEGAVVSYSRLDDRYMSLSDRVKIAKDNDAFISISIHSNSLPNGANPYIKHGTEVHYYNDNAKDLSLLIKNNLARDLNLKDNGIHKSSFALNRSTNPISVLVEVAYMINPSEYRLLQDSQFQAKTAESINNSLKEYMLMLKNYKDIDKSK